MSDVNVLARGLRQRCNMNQIEKHVFGCHLAWMMPNEGVSVCAECSLQAISLKCHMNTDEESYQLGHVPAGTVYLLTSETGSQS